MSLIDMMKQIFVYCRNVYYQISGRCTLSFYMPLLLFYFFFSSVVTLTEQAVPIQGQIKSQCIVCYHANMIVHVRLSHSIGSASQMVRIIICTLSTIA